MDTGWIWRVDGDRAEPAFHTGDAPNGIAIHPSGLIYCAQSVPGIAIVSTVGGDPEVLVSGAFNSPNDLTWVVGELAFSDPTYGLQYSKADARPPAVYAWDGETTRVVLDGLVQPNGLAAGHGDTAYITDSGTQQVHRVEVAPGRPWSILTSVTLPSDRPGVVDGLATWFDAGLLLVSGPGGVWALELETLRAVWRVPFDDKVTNIALAADQTTALVTTHNDVWLGDLTRLRASIGA